MDGHDPEQEKAGIAATSNPQHRSTTSKGSENGSHDVNEIDVEVGGAEEDGQARGEGTRASGKLINRGTKYESLSPTVSGTLESAKLNLAQFFSLPSQVFVILLLEGINSYRNFGASRTECLFA